MLLYKYRPMIDYHKESLEQGYFYFNIYSEVNDPFDCKVSISHDGPLSARREFYLSRIAIHAPDEGTRKELDAFMERTGYDINALYSQKYGNAFRNGVTDKHYEEVVFFCLSANNTNLPMWSHYADKHRGFCLGFEVEQNIDIGNTIQRGKFINLKKENYKVPPWEMFDGRVPVEAVKYSHEMPRPMNRLTENNKRLYDFLITKSAEWSYEKEYRILILASDLVDRKKVFYERSCLKEIVFGLKIDPLEEQHLKNMVQRKYIDKGHHVEMKKCVEKNNEYAIDIVPLTVSR